MVRKPVFYRVIILSFIFILGFYTTALAATHYVDNNHPQASDANPGTEYLPWLHCPGMNGWTGSASLNPGDTVYFDSEDTWTVSSGAYILNITGGVSYIGDSWGSGTRASFQLLTDMINMIQWYDDDPVHETIFKGFEVDGNHYIATGIGMNHPGWSYANSPLNGATKRIQNCVIHDQFCVSGTYRYGIILSSWGDSNQPCPGTRIENVEILDNIIYNQGRVGIIVYPANNNDACYIKNVLIRGNEVYDTAQEVGYNAGAGISAKNHVEDVTIEYNYIHGDHGSTGQCSLFNADVAGSSGPKNIIYRYNICTTTSPTGIHFWNHGNISIQIYGNIIYNIGGRMGIMANYNLDNSFNALIYNNVLFDSGIIISSYPGSTDTLELKNNIIYSTSDIPLTDYSGKITSHNNNLYYRVGGGTLVSSSGSSFTTSNLNSYEATALSSNPSFLNTTDLPTGFIGTYGLDLRPNTDGLSLQSGSPAIDTGADLGSIYNSSINSITRPQSSGWDIGAYESAGSRPDPPKNFKVVQ